MVELDGNPLGVIATFFRRIRSISKSYLKAVESLVVRFRVVLRRSRGDQRRWILMDCGKMLWHRRGSDGDLAV